MRKIILVLISLSFFPIYASQGDLPLQNIKETVQETENKLTPVEEANIVEIYNDKIEFPQFEMGLRYYNGLNGLEKNYDKAIYWFSNSSKDEEYANADMMIASMYYEGKGFEKNKEKAIGFYNRAANRDNLTAQLILTGIYFFEPEFMNQKDANYWIYKAIDNKSKEAINLRALILLNESDYKTLGKLLPVYELNEREEISNFTLGYLYFTGKGVEQSFEKSKTYLERSAKFGNPISFIMLEEIERLSR